MTKKTSFIKKILTVSSGTLIAQIIVFSAYPFITRLYNPEHFGILASFMSILSILTIVSALRLEVAIPLPKNDRIAINLLRISFLVLLLNSFIIFFVLLLFGQVLLEKLNLEQVIPFMFLVPIGIFFIGTYQILSFWIIRKQEFVILAKSKVSQSLSLVVTQLLLGIFTFKTFGLIIGDIFGRFSGIGIMLVFLKKHYKKYNRRANIKFKRSIKLVARYSKFPLISTPSSLINSIGTHVAPLLILSFYGPQIAGNYALAQKVVAVPMILIGQSVAQVYYSEISILFNKKQYDDIKSLFNKTLKKLFAVVIVPTTILIFLGPYIFKTVFGEIWASSGEYVQLMSIMLLTQFIAAPLSQSFYTFAKQQTLLYWDIMRTLFVIGSIVISGLYGFNATNMILLYSMLAAISYIIMIVLLKKIVKEL